MNIKWDADKYSSDFSFVQQYGNSVLDLIEGSNCGAVLDLGCGNGALLKVMHDKDYNVIGIDASKELLGIAKKSFPDIQFIEADVANFSLREPVDIVFSNAVFHWIDRENQQDMLKCVYEALKENGQFVFKFGGYATLLENAGFRVTYAILFDRPTELKGENGLKDWINMFAKTPFSVIKDEKRIIIDKTVASLNDILYKDGKWYADYVWIRMKAIKGLSGKR